MLNALTAKIKKWGYDRKITVNGNSITQLAKLGEEFGELAGNIVRGKSPKDDIGDMYVVLVMIAELEGLSMEECIQHAYDEIKDRKGYLNEHGNFIKENDAQMEMKLK